MISSMTGYGAGEAPFRDAVFSVESRSVNHRYLESSVRGPRWTLSLENEVREAVKKRFARGRFDIFIHYKESNNYSQIIDINAAKNFVTSLERLRDELGIQGEVDLALLTSFKDSLKSADIAFAADEIRGPLMSATETALSNLADMRRREGEALESDILTHLDDVERLAGEVKIHLPEAQKSLTERLRERVIKLAEGVEMNEGRIEQELIFAAERGDINEELSRLASHISQFRTLIKEGEPLGRKLDFLIQEMNRESNTIASKSVDLTLTQKSVDLKSALEKIREQVQNAE
jgi:uncharacterized protein (TIGR00255 family)